MTITDLITGLETRLAFVLGAEYSPLTNVTEVEKNSFKNANKRYGVVARQASEVAGTLKHLTIDQVFQVTLTNGFSTSLTAGDANKREKTEELQDLVCEIYADLKSTKSGSPSVVIDTQDLEIAIPEFLEEDHVIALRFELTIKYRKQL